ncbi:MAG: ADP-dependent glucokinase/phosphofructokinase [Candidatus Micrarchaeia archaeon]
MKLALPSRAAFAFNTNIDAIIHVRGSDVSNLPPALSPLIDSMLQGRAREVVIDRTTTDFILRNFVIAEKRVGGQAGNMAQAAAHLGVKCFLHANTKSTELARLLHKNVLLATSEGFVPSRSFFREAEARTHFVFEFSEGDTVFGKKIPRSNRFIATFDPENSEMRLDGEFERALERELPRIGKIALGGFHLLSPACAHRVATLSGLIRKWRSLNPELELHLELGSFQSEGILRQALKAIAPLCTSLGLNELELESARRALAFPEEGVAALPRLLGLCPTVILHTAEFHLALSRRVPEDSLKRALRFASRLAAYRAQKGTFPSLPELRRFRPPRAKLPKEIAAKVSSLKGDFSLVLLPAPRIRHIRSTVGLGDAFSAGFFLAL